MEWERLGPELHRRGLLTPLDTTVFAVYCQAVHRWITAEELARERGEAADGDEARVLAQVSRTAAAQMAKIGAQFGSSPLARRRAGIDGQDPGASGAGKFGGLLAERAGD
jgi:P27 family predicted phage terminase small subunit